MDVFYQFFLAFSVLFENYEYLALGVVALLALLSTERKKVFLIALAVVLLLGVGLKAFYAEPRPCVSTPGLVDCPSGNGFPSTHAAVAGVLAVAGLGTWFFFVLAPIAAMVAFSRIFLGVHSVPQVFAGLALGAIAYLLVWHYFDRKERKGHEPLRKLAHVGGGIVVLGIGVFYGLQSAVVVSALAFAFGLVLSQFSLLKLFPRGRGFARFFDLMAGGEHPPARGGLGFFAGTIFLFTFARSAEFALAVLAIMTIGDGLAAFVGRSGKHNLPWNKGKTLEGFLAFSLAGTGAAYFFIGPVPALFYALLLGLFETLPLDVDDNVLIPVASLALRKLAGI